MSDEATAHDDGTGYTGTAEVSVGDNPPVTVPVELTGNFDPLAGTFRWHGRIRDLTVKSAAGASPEPGAELRIVTPDGGDATAVVTHLDLWGSHMVDGVSAPPFQVFQP